MVKKFETAVKQGDIDSLKDIVESKDGVTITEDNLKQLTAYAKDEPDYLSFQVYLRPLYPS
ncbi:TcaA second domain-containing protein [Fictibacillus enclensis]|uniref:TcaA second domain-containing protein n=1 Tax=Fictibacillus enclensis TaxID=1017270 RepID=UPI0024C04E1C|nr:hypothetical protein [Fictibacillus enclensis]WHY74531.1 hypothetical protein QNH15_11735 [Fictibacillus enclensis]